MKYIISFIICSCFFSLIAQDKTKLEEGEIKDAEKVDFQNKTRKKAALETKFLNETIGKTLANMISNNPNEAHIQSGVKVIRVPSLEKKKLGGDIISLDESTSFGHVNSIQRILSGYIQVAFQYNSSRADILANYVLYYNGMHRGDIRYFESKYAKSLINKINPSSVGIGIKYKDWPGKTELIIPTENNILKDSQKDITLEELEREVHKIINDKKNGEEDRKKFADLKREKMEEELNEIDQKIDELENMEKEIEARQKNITSKLLELRKDPEKNREEIARLEQEYANLEEQKKGIQKRKEQLIAREEKLTGTKSNRRIVKEIPPPPKEEKKIDPRLLEPEFSSDMIDGKLVFIKPNTNHDNQCVNGIHLLDPLKEDFVFTSDYNKICGRVFKVFGENILVIGYLEKRDQVRLVLLRKNDLNAIGNSDVSVYHKTPLEVRGDFLYAIENLDGKYYLTRFDQNLKNLTRSKEEINPDSIISFYDKKIYVSSKKENGLIEFKIFNKEDLSFVKKTQA